MKSTPRKLMYDQRRWTVIFLLVAWTRLLAAAQLSGDEIEVWENGQLRIVSGAVLARYPDRLVVQCRDQRLIDLPTAGIIRIRQQPIELLDAAALTTMLGEQFPDCRVDASGQFLLVTDLNESERHELLRVLERVESEFYRLWSDLGWPLTRPGSPLVVIVRADPSRFQQVLQAELGEDSIDLPAFYGVRSNRVVVDASTQNQAQQLIARNDDFARVYRTHRTINLVHETTHQLMMNSGMQSRARDYPRWVSEGLAVYFESTQPFAGSRWRSPGEVSPGRLAALQSAVGAIGRGELSNWLCHDAGFLDPTASAEQYSLAWGWCHFMLSRHPKKFVDFLQDLSVEPRDTDNRDSNAPSRRADSFPAEWRSLEGEFRRYVAKIH